MSYGARLIILGSILGSMALGAFLYSIASLDIFLFNARDAAMQQGGKQFESFGEHAQSRNACEISRSYPEKVLRWCELISHYARQRDLPPELVAALILQESGGNPTAYSSSGAVGLMQVMPRDGLAAGFLCASGPCFRDRPPKHKLLDPEFNIKYGTRMLARLVKTHGDAREALKAYGPMDVGYYYADRVLAIYQTYHQ